MNDRPFGVSAVAVWQVAVGVLFASLILLIKFQPGNWAGLGEAFSTVGISGVWVLASTVLFAGASLVSGVALWQGEPLGWWLGTFCSLYAAASNIAAIRLLSRLGTDLDVEGLTPERLTSQLVRAGINGSIFLYMARGETMEYLGVSRERRFKYLLAVASVVLSIFVLSLLFSRSTSLQSGEA
ncbi:MAG: hypothetical protein ACREAA_08910 [Candidatus Polarisedimenticolia bacterium]